MAATARVIEWPICPLDPCRNERSPAERATQTTRRKAIYEELHPETKHGVNQHSSTRQVGDSSYRFTTETASATGKSERVVQRDAERGTKVIGEVIDKAMSETTSFQAEVGKPRTIQKRVEQKQMLK